MIGMERIGQTDIHLFDSKEMGRKEKASRNKLAIWCPINKNKIKYGLKPILKTEVTFLEAFKATLVIGQIFSLIPVAGILSNNAYNIKFSRWSWKYLYFIMSFIGQVYMVVMCIYNVLHSTATLNGSTPIIFYGTTIITMILSVNVARRWPKLAQQISRTEELDPNFDNILMKKCNITLTIVLTLALVEHVLSLIAAISGAMVCLPNTPLYEAFAKYHYPWVFNFLPYYPLLGAITQFIHFQSTFAWNFSDIFVINMSHYLTSRFQQVNRKLIAVHGKYLPEAFWKNSRENYCRITKLVQIVDDVISGVTFISFANNLFFICVQLFNTLEDGIKRNRECSNGSATSKSLILGGYEAAIYFVYSLVFLISRSLAVSLIASQVNIASVAPVSVLYDVPSPVYCVEVQRFIDQVNGKKVALSGLQFFSITRGLVLTVAGTIVTYELVMVQFSSGPSTSAPNTTTAATFFSSQVT